MHRGVRRWPAAEVHDTGGPWVGNKQHILKTEHHGLQSNEQSAIVLGRKSRAGDHVRRPHIREQQQRSKRECPLPCNHPESARKANRWVFRPRISIQYNEYRRINEQFTTSYLTSRIDLNRWDRSSLAHYSPSTVCYAARPCIVELTRLSVFLLTLPMLYSFTLFPTLSSMSHTDTTSRGVHSLSSCSQHWSHHINLIDPALELRVCTPLRSDLRETSVRDPFTYDPTGKKRANAATHASMSFPWTDFIYLRYPGMVSFWIGGTTPRWKRISRI